LPSAPSLRHLNEKENRARFEALTWEADLCRRLSNSSWFTWILEPTSATELASRYKVDFVLRFGFRRDLRSSTFESLRDPAACGVCGILLPPILLWPVEPGSALADFDLRGVETRTALQRMQDVGFGQTITSTAVRALVMVPQVRK
jgi:hypothetical protein